MQLPQCRNRQILWDKASTAGTTKNGLCMFSEKHAIKYIASCKAVNQEQSQDSSAEHVESSCHTFILSLPDLIMSLLP